MKRPVTGKVWWFVISMSSHLGQIVGSIEGSFPGEKHSQHGISILGNNNERAEAGHVIPQDRNVSLSTWDRTNKRKVHLEAPNEVNGPAFSQPASCRLTTDSYSRFVLIPGGSVHALKQSEPVSVYRNRQRFKLHKILPCCTTISNLFIAHFQIYDTGFTVRTSLIASGEKIPPT